MAGAPFDWSEYLRLARDLSANADEASQRTAISRAYYCIYHMASARAIANGYPPGGNRHDKIWGFYQKDANKDVRRLAAWGQAMKHVRESADYKATVPLIPDQMVQQIAKAAEFVVLLTALPADRPHP